MKAIFFLILINTSLSSQVDIQESFRKSLIEKFSTITSDFPLSYIKNFMRKTFDDVYTRHQYFEIDKTNAFQKILIFLIEAPPYFEQLGFHSSEASKLINQAYQDIFLPSSSSKNYYISYAEKIKTLSLYKYMSMVEGEIQTWIKFSTESFPKESLTYTKKLRTVITPFKNVETVYPFIKWLNFTSKLLRGKGKRIKDTELFALHFLSLMPSEQYSYFAFLQLISDKKLRDLIANFLLEFPLENTLTDSQLITSKSILENKEEFSFLIDKPHFTELTKFLYYASSLFFLKRNNKCRLSLRGML